MDASKTQSKHFPGPWRLCYDGQIDAADGRTVARFGWESYREFTELSCDEQKTLRLIAAAPDLLAALSAIVKSLADSDEEGLIEHTETMMNARAALTAAGAA